MQSSLFSAPDRGPWGSSSYPGNCTGHLVRELIAHFNAHSVADPCEGGGTTRDVCQELALRYHGFDLAAGFDLERTRLADALPSPVDLVFLHPPYFRIVRYSGHVWGAQAHSADLSQENDWGRYLARLRTWIEHALSGAAAGGHLALLVGDVHQQGAYFSAQAHVLTWFPSAQVETVIIKAQHHVRSDARPYRQGLIRILHETCIVLRALRS